MRNRNPPSSDIQLLHSLWKRFHWTVSPSIWGDHGIFFHPQITDEIQEACLLDAASPILSYPPCHSSLLIWRSSKVQTVWKVCFVQDFTVIIWLNMPGKLSFRCSLCYLLTPVSGVLRYIHGVSQLLFTASNCLDQNTETFYVDHPSHIECKDGWPEILRACPKVR